MLQGFVTIAGLTSVELNTQDLRSGMTQLEGLLDLAARSRMTACTAMNERSSRSHALFMLDIIAKHSDGTTYLKGGLRLVDLAGSERADRTGTFSDPTRFKETVNIKYEPVEPLLALSFYTEYVELYSPERQIHPLNKTEIY